MSKHLIDTSVFGVLIDKDHREFSSVNTLLRYAQLNKELFATTHIIYSELEPMKKEHWNIVIPVYFATSNEVLEHTHSNKYTDVQKLAWQYIQKLGKEDAARAFPDAENYAWASYANLEAFITINRREILASQFQKYLKKINEEIRLKYVNIITPRIFCARVGAQT